jgi:uncharacterized protein (TIGR00255 family)
MLRSMTGFGASTREEGELSLHAEVRSVNHRHLLVKTRLTGEFAYLEGEVEALVKKKLGRGSLTVSLAPTRAAGGTTARIQPDVAHRYHGEITKLAKSLGVAGEVSLDVLLSLPGVIAGEASEPADAKRLQRAVLGAIDEALTRMVEMREVEGAAIAADLTKHAAATSKLVERIGKRMPGVVRTHQKNLEKRVNELLEGRQSVSTTDVAREVALLADRLDVSEELSRLESHLTQLDILIAKGGRLGRKLDFLVQEIFREINTIGAKCSDAKIAHWVVDAKTHAERLREQVQNVE